MRNSPISQPWVVFDLGGVIIRLSPSLQDAASHAGVCLRRALQPERESDLQQLYFDWQTGRIEDSVFFDGWTEYTGRFDRGDAPRLALGWLREEHPGMLDLVRDLRASGAVLGCLSNTCAFHWNYVLDHPDLYPSMPLITHKAGSHLLGHMKPEIEIYRAYESLTGAAPEHIIFFDDLAVNVDGAQRCGWGAVQVLPETDPVDQMRGKLRSLGVLRS